MYTSVTGRAVFTFGIWMVTETIHSHLRSAMQLFSTLPFKFSKYHFYRRQWRWIIIYTCFWNKLLISFVPLDFVASHHMNASYYLFVSFTSFIVELMATQILCSTQWSIDCRGTAPENSYGGAWWSSSSKQLESANAY